MSDNLVSPCCKAPVWVQPDTDNRESGVVWVNDGATHWYECSACGQACDPIHAKALFAEIDALRSRVAALESENAALKVERDEESEQGAANMGVCIALQSDLAAHRTALAKLREAANALLGEMPHVLFTDDWALVQFTDLTNDGKHAARNLAALADPLAAAVSEQEDAAIRSRASAGGGDDAR